MSEIPVSEILGRYPADRTSSLAVLGDIQAEYKYLPREALEETAKWLHVQLSEIYQIATFFKAFSLTPKGDHIIKVCLGTACYVGGGSRILAAMEKALGIKAGSTTPDPRLSQPFCAGAENDAVDLRNGRPVGQPGLFIGFRGDDRLYWNVETT